MGLVEREPVGDIALPGLQQEGDPSTDDAKADEADKPWAEWLGQQPRGPILQSSAAAGASAEAEGETGRRDAEANSHDAAAEMRQPNDEPLRRGAVAVGVGDGFDEPPGGETKQSQRYEPDEDGPERSEEDPPDRTLAIARPTALAQSGEQRQPADDAIDDASRTEPHAGETLDRIAAHSLHEETFTMTCGGDERTDRVPSNAVRARTAPA